MRTLIALTLLAALCSAKVFFAETFDSTWEQRWTYSSVKGAEAGKFKWSAGKYFGNEEEAKGLQTSEDARFYIASAQFDEFTNRDSMLIFQFEVKHEQNIDCGGGYLKLLPASAFSDATKFSPDSEYNIMFGPDTCGPSNKKTHLIFSNKGTNYLIKRELRADTDEHLHLYTLIVNPDNTYEVRLDNKKVQSGSLEEDWDMVPPKKINDPDAKKPEDWVDEPQMDDPTDTKPDDWDLEPAKIPDSQASKPEDWDDETDGEWEAPLIDNPNYKGVWAAKRIPNPAYKGPWVHPQIDNPAYAPQPQLYAYDSFKYVGIEIWQVKSGTVFDNILLTDSLDTQAEWAAKFEAESKAERAAYDAAKEKERQEAAKSAPVTEDEGDVEKEEL
jgi:calreticulin